MANGSDLFSSGGARLRLEQLTKHYRTIAGEVEAISGIELEIRPGEALAIMGRSGCGKTTLLNMIGGIDHPTSGIVSCDGDDLARYSERALENYRLRKVGFVFQLFNLIPSLTAMDNVMLPMVLADVPEPQRRTRASRLLEQVGMAAKAHKFPDQLSGGEQQRVAVTVALANDPPVILADEPTGNLDSRSAENVADLLCALARRYGKTVVIVSHDPHIPPKADRALTMEDGSFQNGAQKR